ncbi:MAG TPA: hypothetical protein VFD27_19425, partial [Chthoniobacteraceae bacterium]|nr:hypothetical protein [Chthoniobacteraceae bacterium]
VVGAALRVHRPVAEEAVLRVLLNSRRGVAARRRPRHNALRVAIDRRPEVVTVPRNFRRAIARAVRIGLAARIGPAAQTVPAVRIVRVEQIVPEARIARVRARAIVLHSFRPIVPVLALVTAPGLTAPVQELVIAQTKAT